MRAIAQIIKKITGKCAVFFDEHMRKKQDAKRQWTAAEGDKTLRLSYDLNEHSVVLDIGGYEGQWASDIFAMYGCVIHVCEPVNAFFEKITRRFARNKKIIPHALGLSDETKIISVSLERDGTSEFKKGGCEETVSLVKATDFFRENNITKIDLIKINMEGGEYNLLEHLIETGFIGNIKNMQIQFHDFVPDAKKRMEHMRAELQKTHYPTYQYYFIWENWKLKNN